jgi:predicted transporter
VPCPACFSAAAASGAVVAETLLHIQISPVDGTCLVMFETINNNKTIKKTQYVEYLPAYYPRKFEG